VPGCSADAGDDRSFSVTCRTTSYCNSPIRSGKSEA